MTRLLLRSSWLCSGAELEHVAGGFLIAPGLLGCHASRLTVALGGLS
jgi:hypothetical protein